MSILVAMGDSVSHRGPDGAGTWWDEKVGVGLAHRRLAVIDLTNAGAQPMHSADGRFVLAFNGEIYNHSALRQELEAAGHLVWRGRSDTEVLLVAFEQWGIEETLQRCNGMFAIALWDGQAGELVLARDRLGEKPLYVGWVGDDVVFGSELRALRCHPEWRHAVEPEALALMLQLGYVPAPWSIHPCVYKLPAASLIRLKMEDVGRPLSAEEFTVRLLPYWSLDEVVADALDNPWTGTEEEALRGLQVLLDDAVQQRMMADVPVGALLSGGVDSSLVVASMQRQSATPVQTFTVGFDEPGLDESAPARQIAAHLRTDHHSLRLCAASALTLVDRLPDIYDEPFADAAQLPALLVSEAAKRSVTVALTGDGGDELFHGYQRYLDGARAWTVLGRLPESLRRLAAVTAESAAMLAGRGKIASMLRRQAGRLGAADVDGHYANLLVFPGAIGSVDVVSGRGRDVAWPRPPAELDDPRLRMRYVDQRLSLPEGIQTKLDRASMAVGLELRVPLLDHRLVALAWRMPQPWLASADVGKLLLRRLLARQLPPELAMRRKHGFDVPVADWLRGPLREWASILLAPDALAQDPLLNAVGIQERLGEHLDGRADHGYALWALLMYRAWSERYG